MWSKQLRVYLEVLYYMTILKFVEMIHTLTLWVMYKFCCFSVLVFNYFDMKVMCSKQTMKIDRDILKLRGIETAELRIWTRNEIDVGVLRLKTK